MTKLENDLVTLIEIYQEGYEDLIEMTRVSYEEEGDTEVSHILHSKCDMMQALMKDLYSLRDGDFDFL